MTIKDEGAIGRLIEDMIALTPVLPPPRTEEDLASWAEALAQVARAIHRAAAARVKAEADAGGIEEPRGPICDGCGEPKAARELLVEGGGTGTFYFCHNVGCPRGPRIIQHLNVPSTPES